MFERLLTQLEPITGSYTETWCRFTVIRDMLCVCFSAWLAEFNRRVVQYTYPCRFLCRDAITTQHPVWSVSLSQCCWWSYQSCYETKHLITCFMTKNSPVYQANSAVKSKQVSMTGPLRICRSPAGSKWMFGSGTCCPGLVGAVGEEASARLSERWQCARRVCAHSWGCDRKTVRVLLLLLHLSLPVIDLHCNVVNSANPTLMMQSKQFLHQQNVTMWRLDMFIGKCTFQN